MEHNSNPLVKNLIAAASLARTKLPDLGYVEPEAVLLPLTERFEAAYLSNSKEAPTLGAELGASGMLEVFSRLASQGNFQHGEVERIFRFVPLDAILAHLDETGADLAYQVIYYAVRHAYLSRRPMTRDQVFELVVSSKLNASDISYLVHGSDETHLRTNAVANLSLANAQALLKRLQSEGGATFENRLGAILDEEATLQVLVEGGLQGAILAHRIGALTDRTWGAILSEANDLEDLLSLFERSSTPTFDSAFTGSLNGAVAVSVNREPVRAIEIVEKDIFGHRPLSQALLECVTLRDADLLLAVVSKLNGFAVHSWANGSFAANPYDDEVAARWASKQNPALRDTLQGLYGMNRKFARTLVRNLPGFALVFREHLTKEIASVSIPVNAMPHVVEVLGDEARLWERLVEGREGSPYADPSVSLLEATESYKTRWAAAEKRRKSL